MGRYGQRVLQASWRGKAPAGFKGRYDARLRGAETLGTSAAQSSLSFFHSLGTRPLTLVLWAWALGKELELINERVVGGHPLAGFLALLRRRSELDFSLDGYESRLTTGSLRPALLNCAVRPRRPGMAIRHKLNLDDPALIGKPATNPGDMGASGGQVLGLQFTCTAPMDDSH
jgi:hypothetical protein